MSQQPCPTCPTLRAEIARLQLEVAVLQRIIVEAKALALGIAGHSNQKLKAGGLPRGTWSLLKGRAEAAVEIDKALR